MQPRSAQRGRASADIIHHHHLSIHTFSKFTPSAFWVSSAQWPQLNCLRSDICVCVMMCVHHTAQKYQIYIYLAKKQHANHVVVNTTA